MATKIELQTRAASLGISFNTKTTCAQLATQIEIAEETLRAERLAGRGEIPAYILERMANKRRRRMQRKARREANVRRAA